jgi:hypothetical protein
LARTPSQKLNWRTFLHLRRLSRNSSHFPAKSLHNRSFFMPVAVAKSPKPSCPSRKTQKARARDRGSAKFSSYSLEFDKT